MPSTLLEVMNFRSKLISAAALTMFGLGITADPADAASTSCWYGDQSERLEHIDCDVQRRTNYNGHIVWDVSSTGGQKYFTFVLWGKESDASGKADFIYNGDHAIVRWHEDSDGDIRLTNQGGSQLAVRIPGYSPARKDTGVIPAGSAYGDMFQR